MGVNSQLVLLREKMSASLPPASETKILNLLFVERFLIFQIIVLKISRENGVTILFIDVLKGLFKRSLSREK